MRYWVKLKWCICLFPEEKLILVYSPQLCLLSVNFIWKNYMTGSLYLILHLRNTMIPWDSMHVPSFVVHNEGHTLGLSIFLGYAVFHWFLGCLLFIFQHFGKQNELCILLARWLLEMFFDRQNVRPSLNICRMGVSNLEENLRDIREVHFEPWGTKWLKCSGSEKTPSSLYCRAN